MIPTSGRQERVHPAAVAAMRYPQLKEPFLSVVKGHRFPASRFDGNDAETNSRSYFRCVGMAILGAGVAAFVRGVG